MKNILCRLFITTLVLPCFFCGSSLNPTTLYAITPNENKRIEAFEEVSPSVVYITTIAIEADLFNLTVFEVPHGTGSGVIWNSSGYIVTNYHVIEGAKGGEATIKVTLDDRSVHEAKLVGFEIDKDIAVLKIEPPTNMRLRPIDFGQSTNLKIGQDVLAIGTPFGLDRTLTNGIVSGLGRKIQSVSGRPIEGMIQTDAAINPGNSGGPLLDSDGRMIGMNTAIYSPSGAYAGIGFAVPIDIMTRLVPQIIKYGRARKPSLGISLLDDYYARRLGVRGVIVYEVLDDSPAAKAGIKPTQIDSFGRINLGDIILALNDQKVTSANDLLDLLEKHEIGDRITLTLLRAPIPRAQGQSKAQQITVSLVLGSNIDSN